MSSLRGHAEKVWIGWVALVLFSVVPSWVVASVFGGLTPVIAVGGLYVGCVMGIVLACRLRVGDAEKRTEDGYWFWRWAVWVCFVLFALRAFLWLVFDRNGVIQVLSPNNLGDLPLHIQYIRFLAGGAELWPANPVHAHSTIGYPVGMDFFNALLECFGVDLWNGLIATGLAGAAASGMALWRWGRTFVMAAFLFNGGLVGLAFFSTWVWQDYQQTVDWKSLPLALFVTQRGFLYALPAGLLLLTHWRDCHVTPGGRRWLPPFFEWLLYATMPLFHLHTFLFLSIILGWLAMCGEDRKRAWRLIAWSLVPATWLVVLLTDGFQAGSHLQWLPGWMQGPTFSLDYWLKNFGVLPVFLLLLVGQLVTGRNDPGARQVALLAVPSLLVLGLTFLVKFSPWEWDNTKLMMWAYLVLMPGLWSTLLAPARWTIRAGVCLLLFFSGFISLWGGLGPQFRGSGIASRSEVEDVSQAVMGIPVGQIFACAPEYAHPLVFAGRRLALGYHGHMIGHGLEYAALVGAMDDLMNGTGDWQSAARFIGADYVFWGAAEMEEWPQSRRPWAVPGNLVASGSWGEIYRLPK